MRDKRQNDGGKTGPEWQRALKRASLRLIVRVRPPHRRTPPPKRGPTVLRVISWNLLRRTGATIEEVVRLIHLQQPDLLLMQEATEAIDLLAERVGGYYWRTPLPGRIHGLAVWSPTRLSHPPTVLPLPAGTIVRRVSLLLRLPIAGQSEIGIANVHLSHGQVLNRRQLRVIAHALPARAAVLGDYNLIGPPLLPGFDDVGPRQPTHNMADVVPLRLDRCLVRDLGCLGASVLPRRSSDHHPIMVTLDLSRSRAAPSGRQGSSFS